MRKQGLLFDQKRANAARDRAIDVVDNNAVPSSKDAIFDVIRGICVGKEFTTDDVWQEVPPDVRQSVEPRVIGALMRSASKKGMVVKVDGQMRKSAMVRCHARPKQVWRRI